eukprot:3742946-Prymnesium_polylepis.1
MLCMCAVYPARREPAVVPPGARTAAVRAGAPLGRRGDGRSPRRRATGAERATPAKPAGCRSPTSTPPPREPREGEEVWRCDALTRVHDRAASCGRRCACRSCAPAEPLPRHTLADDEREAARAAGASAVPRLAATCMVAPQRPRSARHRGHPCRRRGGVPAAAMPAVAAVRAIADEGATAAASTPRAARRQARRRGGGVMHGAAHRALGPISRGAAFYLFYIYLATPTEVARGHTAHEHEHTHTHTPQPQLSRPPAGPTNARGRKCCILAHSQRWQ